MKYALILALTLGLWPALLYSGEPPARSLAGNWLGTLEVGTVHLRLALDITATDAGFNGTLNSVDQGRQRIPISAIEFQQLAVHLKFNSMGAKFNGNLSADASTMEGKWDQGGQSFPLTFRRTEKPLVLNRPQEPKRPYPYREEAVRITTRKAGLELQGTLTLPNERGPFPAVLLITGSGNHDRDESLMGHRPFLVLSDYLTRRGIAVLRVDDRGVGGSTGNKLASTDDELAEDVCDEVAWLRRRREIDPKRVGLIGHSEGGLIAPLAAVGDPQIAFIVLMAGPGVPMDRLLQTQAVDLARAGGLSEELISKSSEFSRKSFEILKDQADNALAEQALEKLRVEAFQRSTPQERKQLGLSETNRAGLFKVMLTPWFRHIIRCDPAVALSRTKCAVLVLNGEKDLQVSYKENLPAIEAALKVGGNKNFRTVAFPELNHLFQTCKTGLPAEYGEIEETISPSVLQTIIDWITQTVN